MNRIDKLMTAMTLMEKLGQLTMTAAGYAVTGPVIAGDSTEAIRSGAIGNLLNLYGAGPVREMQRLAVEESRLGIPLLIGLDVIHGHRTLFPIPLAETGAFDPELWEATAREAAREAASDGLTMTFAPMLDVSRDPRWGRTAEGPGEDAWLATQLARAKVVGFQGTDLRAPESVAAVAKHFCAYGPVNAGREYASVDVSARALHEVHLPAFEAAVAAGVVAIMPAFTDLAGVPMTTHVPLLRDHLRGKLGFDGVLVSDYNAIGELLRHGVAADLAQAATLAIKAGVDIDMMTDAYRKGLPVALERGLVTIEEIDVCVRRVLALKERLGLFDDPYRRGCVRETAEDAARRRKLAHTAATRSVVMLKNTEGCLPLGANVSRLAVLGPLADAAAEMRGPWVAAGLPEEQVTVVAGLRSGLTGVQILHAAGVPIAVGASVGVDGVGGGGVGGGSGAGGGGEEFENALELCDGVDAVVLCVGEAGNMSGEAASRAFPELPGRQRAFAEAVLARAHAQGKRVIVILFSGRPLIVPWLIEAADAVLAAWFLGNEAGNALADLLSGRASPSGRTPISWPRALGQVPVFFGERPTGRPGSPTDPFTSKYLDVGNDPLFAFGHGLTYGRFEYGALRLDAGELRESDTLTATVDVTNIGGRQATETVFLFTHDLLARVTRPLLELRAFAQITLRSGERGTVRLSVPAAQLRYLGPDLTPVFESGDVEVLVGPCADRSRLLIASLRLVVD